MRIVLIFAFGFFFNLTAAQTPVNKNFSVNKNQKVLLKFDYPELIKISTWDKDEIQISGTVNINDNESNNAFLIKDSKDGNSLVVEGTVPDVENLPHKITVKHEGKKLSFKTREEYQEFCKVNNVTFNTVNTGVEIHIELEIKVPKSLQTQIESKYGIIEVKNFGGEITATSTYGSVDATIVEKNIGKITAETSYGQIYSNLDTQFIGKDSTGFHTLVTTMPGKGSQYNLKSKYGNVYLRKQ
ncbi:MAG TPA: hypothetical protein DIT10_19265 [Chryseobacterium sp.]|nr:hypothetical protein [Chryseobacterium sp.]